jgi:hypothetical protein
MVGAEVLTGGEGGGDCALTSAVGNDEADVDPPVFLAVMTTRIVLPTSAAVRS